MNYKSIDHIAGDVVHIVRADKKLDPNVYIVKKKDRNLTYLYCEDTEQTIRVHSSRVVQKLGDEEEVSNDNDTTTATTKSGTAISKTTKAAKATKKTKTAMKVNFKELLAERNNAEHWSRQAKNDVQNKKTVSHVILFQEGDQWKKMAFNTYDGCLGPSGKTGRVYDVKDYEKAVALLKKSKDNPYKKR